MKILVTGGCGYIGSHVVAELLENTEHSVVVVDSLAAGYKKAIPTTASLEQGKLQDTVFLDGVFKKHKPDAVMHLAASISVPESCEVPCRYYENNTAVTNTLAQVMMDNNCKYLVLSSTAAVFGMPKKTPIEEDDEKEPTNPYGHSKLMCEQMLQWIDKLPNGVKSVSLRYFNASGAHKSGDVGEWHEPQTHLIPVVLSVAAGKRDGVKIFGTDFETKDGTCIRDYVHVTDLATAHIKALDYLVKGGATTQFNLGNGTGFSVKEIIECCRKVTGHPIPAEDAPRRAGDPAVLVASSKKAEEVLGWKQQYPTVDSIVETHWNWVKKHPNGYSE